ncbi:ADP-ribosylglycohydrolase family protein [Cohnella silvisoli]|uniref:ADP-ribosylglycohydrolase family protein n=1 Tax=Cohnella silvisoli TaxID=2873699 RepID=A0ABV1KZR7_9BACL|nr:ADP-ribosylglycohydrolase family protein [Cohnella silvisoli]MCD9025015.1 ADP-ribosylglycohydrolase family protein [Cohnella silvisoli]
MKKTLTYETYRDKVFGAWLGKSIAGTVGAPYEGRKELFHYEYDPKAIKEMLPNDDLELQVLWLEVMEKKGIYFNTDDLAEAFHNQCPYAPGEYGVFMKNFARGIHPPVSGAFNNRYYVNGMGCPIRAEIWACISPGNPELAAEFAAKDGIMDHEGDSVYTEQFWAAIESAAFFESDLPTLFEIGLAYLPKRTRIRQAVEDTFKWCESERDWVKVRERIIREYGHPDCTNLYQNTAFTLVALICGQGHFLDSTMIALNCGYDTDCSCATAGALLGIIQGAAYLKETYDFYDTSYVLGIDVTRSDNNLETLADDTCRVGLTMAMERNALVEFAGAPAFIPVPTERIHDLEYSVDYHGDPVIGLGESKRITLNLNKAYAQVPDMTFKAELEVPEGWISDWQPRTLRLDANGISVPITFTVPESLTLLQECNRMKLQLSGDGQSYAYEFGLNGAQVWKIYGPFWENAVSFRPTELGEWYSKQDLGFANPDHSVDAVRQYHLNAVVDSDKDYLADQPEYKLVNLREDLFSVSDFFGYQGPCVAYAERRLHCPEDREVHVMVGHTDGYRLWINDEEISASDERDWWTAENKHHRGIKLRKGENRIVLKCIRRGASAEYSLIFSEKGSCMPQQYDYGSYI